MTRPVILAAVSALPVHSISGYEWECDTCHFGHPNMAGESPPCEVCGKVHDDRNLWDYDSTGRPCDHGNLLDRDAVLAAIEAVP